MFFDFLFLEAAVAADQLAVRYDSQQPLVVAAASSSNSSSSNLGGQPSAFLVCLNKYTSALDKPRPDPALHTLVSGALATDTCDLGVTLSAMLSLLLPAA